MPGGPRERFTSRPAEQWEFVLSASGIPAARVGRFTELTNEGRTRARGILKSVPAPTTDDPDHSVALPTLGVAIDGVLPGPCY